MPGMKFVPLIVKKMVDDYAKLGESGAPPPEVAPTMLYALKGAPSPSRRAPVSSHAGDDHSRGMMAGL